MHIAHAHAIRLFGAKFKPQDRSRMATHCPMFTERHIHHSAVWIIEGFSVSSFCLACATERLEHKSIVPLHCRQVLNEFQALLSAQNKPLIHILSSDRRILDHFSTLVFGLLVTQDATIAQLALDVLSAVASQFSTTEVPRKLMQKAIQTVMAAQNFSGSYPYLTFVGRLLHTVSPLCTDLIHSFGGFLEYLLSGLAYPEENVKSAVVYILAQLSMKTPQNSLPTSLVHSVCQFISSSLASAKSHNLTLNLLGLVKGVLKSSVYAQCLLQTDRHTSEAKGSTLASAFKRVLLSNDETLQLSGVQCVAEVLNHHPQYGQTLLQADIAEFLFEALTSKKELLMTSLFSCLNSLATVSDFYSKGHIIYGMDQIIVGLSIAIELKNYSAVNQGLTFLSNVLSRQPATMPLFTSATAESVQKLLSVLHTALQTPAPAVVLSAITIASHLLCTHHLPPGFSLSTLLPILSLHLYLVELHLLPVSEDREHIPSPSLTSHSLELLTSVLRVMENINMIYYDLGRQESGGKVITSEEVTTFLSASFEETILPAVLMNTEKLNHCQPFSALFKITRIQLETMQDDLLPLRLANIGFIHYAFDIKSKFFSDAGSGPLCGSINECVESLCCHLEPEPYRQKYIKETLHLTLPHINCEMGKSLEFLIQRAPSLTHTSVQIGTSTSVTRLQRAVLVLFYFTQHEKECITPAQAVLQAINRFLILNPDIHLMPSPSLTHLTALYAVSVHNTKSASSDTATEGSQILVRALLRVASPSSVFTATPHLLSWAFAQPLLVNIARAWVNDSLLVTGAGADFWEWLQCLCASDKTTGDVDEPGRQNCWSMATQFIQTTPHSLDILLDTASEEELSTSTLSLIDHLLSQQCLDGCKSQKMFRYLQRVLLSHRVQPLSDCATASVLSLLAKGAKCHSVSPDLKLIYNTINFITRCDTDAVVTGLNLLRETLSDSKEVNTQVLALLQNNAPFLKRLVQCVPTSSLPKDHSLVSATALQLMGSLIYHQHKSKSSYVSGSGGVIALQSALAALLHHSATVLVSGLYFWRIILCTGFYTGCYVLAHQHREVCLNQDVQSIKKLTFLVQNCMVKDDVEVREAAAQCLTELLKYTSIESEKTRTTHKWNTAIIDHISNTVHSHIPSYYLPCIETLLTQVHVGGGRTHQLKKLAQVLYNSLVTEHNSTRQILTKYAACFKEIQKIDKTLLDANQWTHLNKTLP